MIVLCVLASFGADVLAYQSFLTRTGTPVHWESLVVPLEVADNPADVGYDEAVEIIEAAARTWQSVPCHPLVLHHVGKPTGKFYAIDGHNRVLWMNDLWPGSPVELAFTVVTHDQATGQIVDADLLINDTGYLFGSAAFGDPLTYDLPGVITHEFGHLLGLDHSEKADATMTDEIDILTVSTLSSLHADDMVGLCSVYEPRTTSAAERQNGYFSPPNKENSWTAIAHPSGAEDWSQHALGQSIGRWPLPGVQMRPDCRSTASSSFLCTVIMATKHRPNSSNSPHSPIAVWLGVGAAIIFVRSRFFFVLGATLVLTYAISCEHGTSLPSDTPVPTNDCCYLTDTGQDSFPEHETLGGDDVFLPNEDVRGNNLDLQTLINNQRAWTIRSATTKAFRANFGETTVVWPTTPENTSPKIRFDADGRLRQLWPNNGLGVDNGCNVESSYLIVGNRLTWTMTTPSTFCPGERTHREESLVASLSATGDLVLTTTSSAWVFGNTGRPPQPMEWVLTPSNDFNPDPCPAPLAPIPCDLECVLGTNGVTPLPGYTLSCAPPPESAMCAVTTTDPQSPRSTEQKCSHGCYEVVCRVEWSDSAPPSGGCSETRTGKSCSYR